MSLPVATPTPFERAPFISGFAAMPAHVRGGTARAAEARFAAATLRHARGVGP